MFIPLTNLTSRKFQKKKKFKSPERLNFLARKPTTTKPQGYNIE